MRYPQAGFYLLIFAAVAVLVEHVLRHLGPWSYITPLGLIVLAILNIRARRHNDELADRLKTFRCLTCGYCLTGNTSGACPECGKPILPGQYPRLP